jgi:hypothetical protein
MTRTVFLTVAFICLSGVLVLVSADQFWEKPFTRWNEKQVHSLLNDSPWARQMTLASQSVDSGPAAGADSQMGSPRDLVSGGRGYGQDKGSGISGEKEQFYGYTVRLFSALPIRQAYVRNYQIANQYDRMSREEKQAFDARFSRALNLDTGNEIIVAVHFSSNDRQVAMEVDRQLKQATFELLKQSAYLISDRIGRVQLKGYFPPSPDGTGAKLIFPREVREQPVVSDKDRELKLEFFVPGTEHKVFVTWPVARMVMHNQVVH